jgi:hypothetical protein
MKFKASLNKFLTNKLVLNTVAIIALLNIIGYLVLGNYNAVVYFIAFAVLIRFFSKNMIIVLGVPVFLVSLLSYKNIISEGMENNNGTGKETNNQQKKPKVNESMENLEYGQFKNDNKNNKNDKNDKKNNKQDPKTNQGLPITPVDSEDLVTSTDQEPTTTASTVASTDAVVNTGESFEVGRGKRRAGSQIDYASTVEDAYDELNKILGSDGVKKLTDDTQRLMKQQLQLAESMKSMTPLIQGMGPMLQSAKEMMKGFGDNKQDLGGILKLADQLNVKK